MRTNHLFFALIVIVIFASRALAYPEFSRHGYFSCSSCHVSPGGGSTLTDYGRSFAAEKLSTWSRPGEERAFHGAFSDLPAWLLLGGNIRQIQTYVETPKRESGRWIMMQRDLDACLKSGPAISCATFGITERAEESDSGKTAYGLRKLATRIDFGPSFIARVGRFFPRYGLMIANHTSPIRRNLGFEANRETDQIELTYLSETFEANLARDFGRSVQLNRHDQNETFAKGWVGSVAYSLTPSARAGASFRQLEQETSETQTGGFFLSTSLGDESFLLAEIDQQAVRAKQNPPGSDPIQRTVVSHLKVGHDLTQGLVGFLQHETSIRDLKDRSTRQDTYGLGLQWFPRPHFEIEGFVGHVLIRSDFSYARAGYLLLHYYL